MKLAQICDWLISFSFSTLFFLTPLILTPWNYELFEYNKMMLVYGLTIIIAGSWLIKMVVHKRLLFQRTPFDLPIALFFVSQFLSFLFSMDRHVSLFGYYSRFNGGLFSIFSYLLLYYALVSNINKDQVVRFLKLSLLSALVVSLYGIMERFGIDKDLWMQDVQNRVFSTLGQPNWLGAYLAIMIPLSISFVLINKSENSEYSENQKKRKNIRKSENLNLRLSDNLIFPSFLKIAVYYLLAIIFYLCLLYTKSRSGLMGLGIGLGTFFVIGFLFSVIRKRSAVYLFTSFKPIDRKPTNQLASQGVTLQNFFRPLLIISTCYFLLSVLVGTPWTPSLSELFHRPPNTKYQILNTSNGPALETGLPAASDTALQAGGTESGEIRKIVWQGAIDIARRYPLFGTGPETFAFSYYKFRPVAHNLVSEWDFLYNKAHNEYLNYAATTGFVGLGTYIFLIGSFLFWSFKKMWEVRNEKLETEMRNGKTGISLQEISFQYPASHLPLLISLLAAYISILITNFFGFSVVIVSVYFWLIPAMIVIINAPMPQGNNVTMKQLSNEAAPSRCRAKQWFIIGLILLSAFYFLLSTLRLWYADVRFNRGYQLARAGYYQQAYEPFNEAIDINPREPFYRDELSFVNAVLAVSAFQQKESTLSAQLALEAISQNQKALSVSPQNVNFWKTQTKVYYTLSSLDPNSTAFNQKALKSLQMAKTLSPTDPKIAYNIALINGRLGKSREAIKTLEETIMLKPNYQDARYALALFYHEAGKKQEARNQLEYILQKISPDDKQVKAKLKEL